MTLTQRLSEYVRACFTGLWIESHEHQDALVAIAQLCRQEDWRLATWNVADGLRIPDADSDAGGSDPLAAIRALNSLATPEGTAILVLQNFHRFLQSAEIVQALAQQVITGKQNRTMLVVLSPVVSIPVELEKLFVVLEHELPNRKQLNEIAQGIATEDGELPEGTDREAVLDAALGLTRYEAESAYSLSLVREGRLTAATLWEQKAQTLKKSGLLQLYRGGETFADLGGLESLKQFCSHALRRSVDRHPEAKPRGILLLSPPGCGKTSLAKALGNELNRPTILLDVGTLMGGLVGATEQNTRRALATIDAMGSSVVLIDEVEKALAGVQNGSQDSGVSARMFGCLLSWMADDRRSEAFLVLTSNDASKLPPEFLRSERLDASFFLDLPGREEKDIIWEMYLRRFALNPDQTRPKDDLWTGAELKSCCRLSSLLNVPLVEAAKYVVPVAVTAAESVERLRTWASGRCLDASRPGIYQHDGSSGKSRRRVSRDPSNN